MVTEQETFDAFTPSREWERVEQASYLTRLFLGDTEALRRDKAKVLPKFEKAESVYNWRIEHAEMPDFYWSAIHRVVAALTANPIELTEPPDDFLSGLRLKKNIDGSGRSITQFLRPLLWDAVGETGRSGVLVDHTQVAEGTNLAQARADGARPKWAHFKSSSVLAADKEVYRGRKRWSTVRLLETVVDKASAYDPGTEVEQVRELFPGYPDQDGKSPHVHFVIWRKDGDGKAYELEDQAGVMSPHVDIPFRLFVANDGGPPYKRLAEQCRKWVRHDSDLALLHHVSSLPVWHRRGAAEDMDSDDAALSAGTIFTDTADFAEMTAVEHSGSSLGSYAEYLGKTEDRIEALSLLPHVKRTGAVQTATGAQINNAQATTDVAMLATELEGFVDELLRLTAIYLTEDLEAEGGSANVNLRQVVGQLDVDKAKAQVEIGAQLGIPEEVILRETQACGIWSQGFDPEQVVAQMDQPEGG